MKIRDLEAALQRVRPFDTKLQKIDLEQFPTGWHIAARLVHTAAVGYGDIEGKTVVDLGTGTAMLGIGCALLGASCVVGLDADMDALAIAKQNIDDADIEEIMDLILCDVTDMPFRDGFTRRVVDTVVMNPPFGTRNKGIDVVFLEKAVALRPHAIYSLHKTSTRKFLLKKAEEWGLKVEVIAELKFDIPKMYSYHKQKTADVEVDFIRFELSDAMRALPRVPDASLAPACTPPVAHLVAHAPSQKSGAPAASAAEER